MCLSEQIDPGMKKATRRSPEFWRKRWYPNALTKCRLWFTPQRIIPRPAIIAIDILEKRRKDEGANLLVHRCCAFHSAQVTGRSRSAIRAS